MLLHAIANRLISGNRDAKAWASELGAAEPVSTGPGLRIREPLPGIRDIYLGTSRHTGEVELVRISYAEPSRAAWGELLSSFGSFRPARLASGAPSLRRARFGYDVGHPAAHCAIFADVMGSLDGQAEPHSVTLRRDARA